MLWFEQNVILQSFGFGAAKSSPFHTFQNLYLKLKPEEIHSTGKSWQANVVTFLDPGCFWGSKLQMLYMFTNI